MNLQYVKRYRMELDLRKWQRLPIALPLDYRLVAFDPALSSVHAEVKFRSFRDEIDAQLFPCLGELTGCLRLMSEIEQRDGFLPQSTWLVRYVSPVSSKSEWCGTIQAVRTHRTKASIQNIGVSPHHRGLGLGSALILSSLLGLQKVGVPMACLEVTAENDRAIRLYRRIGFRSVRTLYKSVELACTAPAR